MCICRKSAKGQSQSLLLWRRHDRWQSRQKQPCPISDRACRPWWVLQFRWTKPRLFSGTEEKECSSCFSQNANISLSSEQNQGISLQVCGVASVFCAESYVHCGYHHELFCCKIASCSNFQTVLGLREGKLEEVSSARIRWRSEQEIYIRATSESARQQEICCHSEITGKHGEQKLSQCFGEQEWWVVQRNIVDACWLGSFDLNQAEKKKTVRWKEKCSAKCHWIFCD